jgi:putative membrane protein
LDAPAAASRVFCPFSAFRFRLDTSSDTAYRSQMLRLTLAWLHLIALGIGFWAVFARGQALREAAGQLPGTDALRRAFRADAHWGAAAALWLATGLWRYLASTEKATAYYNSNHIFLTKMALFVVVVALEIAPMMTLMRWRAAVAQAGVAGGGPGGAIDPARARRIASISYLQGAIVAVMVFTAVAMARGYGASG